MKRTQSNKEKKQIEVLQNTGLAIMFGQKGANGVTLDTEGRNLAKLQMKSHLAKLQVSRK